MAKIFISYKREDRDIVFPIVDYVRKQTKIDCWIDINGVESGSLFEYKIAHAIDACEVVLFFMSKNSIAPFVDKESGMIAEDELTWTQREIAYALDRHKKIVSVSIDGTVPSDSPWFHIKLIGKDYIDYSDNDKRKKLLRDLEKWTSDSNIKKVLYEKQIVEASPKDATSPAHKQEKLSAEKKQDEDSFFNSFFAYFIVCALPYLISLTTFIVSSNNYVQDETPAFRVIVANIASYLAILSLIWSIIVLSSVDSRRDRNALLAIYFIMIGVTALVFTKYILPYYTILWGF